MDIKMLAGVVGLLTLLLAAVEAVASTAAPVQCASHVPGSLGCKAAEHDRALGFIDLTVPVQAGLPAWERTTGLRRNWRALSQSIAEGDVVNQSHLNLDAHTGTHIDAPLHFLQGGDSVDQLPLSSLVGPALIVDVPDGTNVTAEALEALGVPEGAERLLFRTENTRRGLMARTPFASDYVGLDSSAARWLAKNRPEVVLVGVDYLSIGMLDDIIEAHKELFRKGTVVVEGLNLTSVPTGTHHLTCLPLRLVGSDGSPARCILTPLAAS